MALFGLLWLMRIRAEVKRKDKRNRRQCHQDEADQDLVLPPPVSFADRRLIPIDDTDDIPPPPPPPPLRQLAQIHRSASIHDDLVRYRERFRPTAQSLSRSAQNLRIECTCPLGSSSSSRSVARSRPSVRFRDDPFGFYSARGACQSWNYPSVVSTLTRARTTGRSAHG